MTHLARPLVPTYLSVTAVFLPLNSQIIVSVMKVMQPYYKIPPCCSCNVNHVLLWHSVTRGRVVFLAYHVNGLTLQSFPPQIPALFINVFDVDLDAILVVLLKHLTDDCHPCPSHELSFKVIYVFPSCHLDSKSGHLDLFSILYMPQRMVSCRLLVSFYMNALKACEGNTNLCVRGEFFITSVTLQRCS